MKFMKTGELEKFIQDNRDGFDSEIPDVDTWDKIVKLEPHKSKFTISWRVVASRAAAVVFIFVASYYFHEFTANRKVSKDENSITATFAKNEQYQKFVEAEQYYNSKIVQRKKELFLLTSDKPVLHKEVNKDLDDLNQMLLSLKEDLKDNADNQEVIEAMIQNYMLRLEILEDMLNIIKSKQDKKETHETHKVI